MEKFLSQEEIDAMVRAARGGGPVASPTPSVMVWEGCLTGQIGREQLPAT